MMKIPDRVSTDPKSPFHVPMEIARRLLIKLDGVEQKGTVLEFHITGGWVRRYVLGPDKKPLRNVLRTGWRIERINGKVEASWR